MPQTSFYYGNPELYGQELALRRRQMLADMLQQEAQQPATPDSWNHMPVVPRLGVGGALAKVGQMLGAAELQKQQVGAQEDLYRQQLDYTRGLMGDRSVQPEQAMAMAESEGPPTQEQVDAARAISGQHYTVPTDLNPYGAPSEAMARAAMQNPDAFYENQVYSRYAPTAATRDWQQKMADPVRRMFALQLAGKESAPQPGSNFTDPTGGMHYTATVPQYSNADTAPSGQVTNVTPEPGAAGALAANAAAQSLGGAQGETVAVTTPDGRVVQVPKSSIVGNPPSPNGTAGAPSVARPNVVNVSPQQGQSTTDAALQRAAADRYGQAQASLPQTRQSISGLEHALNILETVAPTTGPGSQNKFNTLGYLQTAGIPLMQGDTTGYQTLHKFLANGLYSAAGATAGTGSDERFESFFQGQPNTEMGAPALKSAIRYVLSQQDARVAGTQFVTNRAQALSKQGDPNAIQHAYEQWNQTYDPNYFEARRQSAMPSAPQNATSGQIVNLASMGPALRVNGGWQPVPDPVTGQLDPRAVALAQRRAAPQGPAGMGTPVASSPSSVGGGATGSW